MKQTHQKITPLSIDIRAAVKNFDASVEMTRLCNDVSDPILLPDEKPVMNISQDEFVGIFDLRHNHHFLTPDQVFRVAIYCRLELPCIIALLIKSSWEIYLAEMIGYAESEKILEPHLTDQATLSEHLRDFIPEAHEIHQLIIQIPYDTNMTKSRENVNLIIGDLMKEAKFLKGNKLISHLFPVGDHSENSLLRKASVAQQQEYQGLKSLWKIKNAEFEDKLLLLERKKRTNINLTDRYFRTFGNLELKLASLNYKCKKFQKVLELKHFNPEGCYREILKAAIEAISAAEKKQLELRDKYSRSLNFIGGFPSEGPTNFSTNDYIDYEVACKQVLKQLYMLLHPDMYSYKEVSEQARQKLDELWLELMQANEERLVSYSNGLLLSSQPDYYKLRSMLNKVCDILNIDVDNLKVGDQLEVLIKQGSSVKKLIEFLNSDLQSLQFHLSNLELKQYTYSNDEQTQIYREALMDLEAHREKLQSDIINATQEIVNLKAEVRIAFKSKAA
jgi:hypothetical protein